MTPAPKRTALYRIRGMDGKPLPRRLSRDRSMTAPSGDALLRAEIAAAIEAGPGERCAAIARRAGGAVKSGSDEGERRG